eukprot:gene9650-11832_t
MSTTNLDTTKTKVEIKVDISCNSCVETIKKELSNKLPNTTVIGSDVENQRMVLEGNDLTIDIVNTIKSLGKTVSVYGFGSSGSGVCTLGKIADWERGCGGAGGVGSEGVFGVVRIVPISEQDILVEGKIEGLKPGDHSIAIHEYGDLSDGCCSVGEPYIPMSKLTPSLTPTNSDVNNNVKKILGITTVKEDGQAKFRVLTKNYQLPDLIGRSIVLHGDSNIGPLQKRIACGIISRAAGVGMNPKQICPCENQTDE